MFALILHSSCQNHDSEIALKQSLDQLFRKTEYRKLEKILIIPGTGCEGCITGAESFIKDHHKDLHRTKIILTNIKSIKILKAKIGLELFKSKDVIVDSLNILERYGFLTRYPVIVILNRGDIEELQYFNPSTDINLTNLLQE